MAGRARRKNEFDFFEGLMALVLFIAFITGFGITDSVTGGIIAAGAVFAVIIVILIVIRYRHEQKIKRSGIHDIDKMDGIQFEHYLKLLFSTQGYKVEVTRAAGDYGADLILRKDNKKIVVQAKRYAKNVGISAIQDLLK